MRQSDPLKAVASRAEPHGMACRTDAKIPARCGSPMWRLVFVCGYRADSRRILMPHGEFAVAALDPAAYLPRFGLEAFRCGQDQGEVIETVLAGQIACVSCRPAEATAYATNFPPWRGRG